MGRKPPDPMMTRQDMKTKEKAPGRIPEDPLTAKGKCKLVFVVR